MLGVMLEVYAKALIEPEVGMSYWTAEHRCGRLAARLYMASLCPSAAQRRITMFEC